MKWGLLLALACLAACSKVGAGSDEAAAPSTGPPPPQLARIFTADMLGANLAYLETITGPAFKTEGDDGVYKVGGCTVIVGSTKGKIDNLGIIGYSDRCSFNIAQYFASGYTYPVPSIPTFADIRRGFGGDFSADCLRLCGNAADPVVTLDYEGSHADNFNTLQASIDIDADPALGAYQDWSDKLVAKYGEAKVARGEFVDDDNLDSVAGADFGPLHPTTVRVGTNLVNAPVAG